MAERLFVRKGLSANVIKLIAIIAMTVDHIAWVVFPGLQTAWYVVVLHLIGRLTAPIMWFFIAEGCAHTRDIGRYIFRMFIFAAISHFAYDFAFGVPYLPLSSGVFNQTSVMWPLFLAVVTVAITRMDDIPRWVGIVTIITACVLAFPSDWSTIAMICPVYLYYNRKNFKIQAMHIMLWTFIYATVYFFFIDKPYAFIQLGTWLTIPILFQYNGERGKLKGMKWFFYIFYPAHLVVIGILRIVLHGDISLIF